MESMFKAIKNYLLGVKQKITVGICAMEKKTRAKPMQELLRRLDKDIFEIIIFGDDLILNAPIEKWPNVDALIAFYSKGYPLAKALEYIQSKKNMFCLNDLSMESTLADRRKVYKRLEELKVNVPKYVVVDRDDPNNKHDIQEFDDCVEINGVKLNKPIVEKPVDAEDHNIYIYYPLSSGGGSKRLFRKIDNKSSEFYQNENELRQEGSFIYEEFLTTQGTDVKVYTVGPDYAHAEARKSPVVDGKVNRDNTGFEIRFPVILNDEEKDFARLIVEGFKQTVCGFDILRVTPKEPGEKKKSYVCDVNGFSFVKKSNKYYDDASQVIAELLLSKLRPQQYKVTSTRAPLMRNSIGPTFAGGAPGGGKYDSKESSRSPSPSVSNGYGSDPERASNSSASPRERKPSSLNPLTPRDPNSAGIDDEPEELRCVIAVIRHGDRTPKQKMKVKCSVPEYLSYFHTYAKPEKDLKVKSKTALVKFLEVTRQIIISSMGLNPSVVLEESVFRKLRQMKDVLERWEISGINRKLQMKPQKWDYDDSVPPKPIRATELLLILKWGGDLTPLGKEQAELVGTQFRQQMYSDQNGGVLRLHSTYRHDLKIKASDEGRVQKTAAAFAKGLLSLEGALTPILVSMVEVEEKNRQMLDRNGNFAVGDDIERCKAHLNLLQETTEMSLARVEEIAPNAPTSVKDAMLKLNNPRQTLEVMYDSIGQLCNILREFSQTLPQQNIAHLLRPIVDTPHNNKDGDSELTREKLSLLKLSAPSGKEGEDKDKVASAANSEAPATPEYSRDSSIPDTISSSYSSGADISKPDSLQRKYSHSYPTMSKSISTDSFQNYGDGLYLNETYDLMCGRWEKLHKDFYNSEKNVYDLSKVPDVYDMIRYDCLHNGHLNLKVMEDLYEMAATLENIIVPQEYGTDQTDKLRIGSKMCGALLQKIKGDLEASHMDHRTESHYTLDEGYRDEVRINTIGRHVRTRLYFTSESHIHTLLNELRYPGEGKICAISPEGQKTLDEIPELCYLTQVVIRLFEDQNDETKFRCEIAMSPGANNSPWGPVGSKHNIAPMISLNKSINYDDLIACLDNAIRATDDKDAKSLSRIDSEGALQSTEPAISSPSSKSLKNKTTVVSSSGFETSDNWESQYQRGFVRDKDRSASMDKGSEVKKEKKDKRSFSGGTLGEMTPQKFGPSGSASLDVNDVAVTEQCSSPGKGVDKKDKKDKKGQDGAGTTSTDQPPSIDAEEDD